jgi:Zn-dependent metalloprotease
VPPIARSRDRPIARSCCFLPPHIVDRLAESSRPALRRLAYRSAQAAAAARDHRALCSAMPGMAAVPSPERTRDRRIYDMQGTENPLPGVFVRGEADPRTSDEAVSEAFDHSGIAYDYFHAVHGRNSLDDNGMTLISSVHYGDAIANAFWNGEQMLYGDGDGILFDRFTRALDVAGHELTHGVIQFTANLEYYAEPGALNEHFADVFGVLARFWHARQDPAVTDNWWLGGDLFLPDAGVRGIRTFTADKAYEGHPDIGDDPQPKHYSDRYTGTRDYGGVHINSGIPNHAFYRAVLGLGDEPLKKAAIIWYETLRSLSRYSDFQEAADKSHQSAIALFGAGSAEADAVQDGWAAVGVAVRQARLSRT